ncbi:MAG: pentapeptide repeat-containing protein, partial [Actinomycetales bacterium]
DANLAGAWFGGADLRGATFIGADLVGTVLAGADLRGATFPNQAFDSRGRPRFSCDRNTKRDGALRVKLRRYCKGVRNVIYLQAK